MATKTWQGNGDNWTTDADWDPAGEPGSGDDVVVASGDPQVTTDVGTIGSLADSATVDLTEGTTPGGVTTFATLAVSGATTIAGNSSLNLNDHSTFTTGSLTNDDDLSISGGVGNGTGGDRLTVNGLLTNTSGIDMGGATFDQRTAGDLLTTQGLSNTGSIYLGGSSNVLTEIDVTQQVAGFGTAGVLTGSVSLANNSEIVFDQGGGITQIGNGGLGGLTLDGTQASIQDAGGAQNGALTGVSEIESGSGLSLGDGAVLNLSGNLQNDGGIGLDTFFTSVGGTQLNVAGTLTNTPNGSIDIQARNGNDTINVGAITQTGTGANGGSISLDGSAPGAETEHLAELNVTSGAGFGTAGLLQGGLDLTGDALVQFGGGEITTLGDGTLSGRGSLLLDGTLASVSNGSGQDSGLALADITAQSSLTLADGAQLTTGNLDNAGSIAFDDFSTAYDESGTTLTVDGTLTNELSGSIAIQPPSGQDTLIVHQAAGFGTVGTLTGSVYLNGTSGAAVVQFDSGGISTIAAKSSLTLDGASASVQDANGTQNGALAGLSENDGFLGLENGVSLAINDSLNNTGTVQLYNGSTTNNVLNLAGTLTNSGSVNIYADANTATINAQGIDNVVGPSTTGSIDLEGSYNNSTMQSFEAELDVSGAAGFGTQGVLTGKVTLDYDSVLQFASGGIGAIAAGSTLSLESAGASMQDAGGAQNSALAGLSDIAGTLTLQYSAALATGGAPTGAASTLTVGNTMTDSGKIDAATIDVASGGSLTLANGQANAAITVENNATFAGTGTTSGGTVTVAAGGTFNPGGDPGTISTGSLSLASGSTFAVNLGGTPQSGDFGQDDVSGTVSLGGATLSGSIVYGYTPTVGDSFEIIANDGTDAVSGTFAGLAQGAVTDIGGNEFQISYTGGDGNDVTLTDLGAVVCFASGTRIRTTRGDVAVEALAVGDQVVTASGEARPIRWLGHRTLRPRQSPRPHEAQPVRIRAHAFGPGLPARALVVSPGHSICVDAMGEVLIPAAALVDGGAVAQLDVDAVTYWHVELDSHDVLLAENLPAESYLEMGNRGFFAESGLVALAGRPDAPVATHADFCRPFHDGGALVAAVCARLAARSRALARETVEVAAAPGPFPVPYGAIGLKPYARVWDLRPIYPRGNPMKMPTTGSRYFRRGRSGSADAIVVTRPFAFGGL